MSNRRHPSMFVRPLLSRAVLLAAAGVAAQAQMHHVDAPEHVTRAVGVYEWTGELTKPTAARFVPVSLFINGRFEDAGLYLARPVPFALQPGDVYALEHAGEPTGVLDLDLAHRVVTGKALADDNPVGAWYGFGKFTPRSEPKVAALHPSSHIAKIESSPGPNTPAGAKLPAAEPDRPHMNRRDAGTGSSTDASPASSTGTSTNDTGTTTSPSPSSNSPKSGGGSDDDTDRPTLRRRDPAQDAARRKEANAKSKTASVTAAGPALGDDPDRPLLGHNAADMAATPELTGLPADLHQAVAVSDAGHIDAHPFARQWESPEERAEILHAMATLARTRVADYLAANRLTASNVPLAASGALSSPGTQASSPASPAPATDTGTDAATDTAAPPPPKLRRGVPQGYGGAAPASAPAPGPEDSSTANPVAAKQAAAKPAATKPAATKPAVAAAPTAAAPRSTAAARRRAGTTRTAATRPATLTLRGEEVAGFTLSYGGLPTFVYTAAAAVVASGVSGGSTAAQPTAAYVTLVAQRLPSGELQVALGAVTDNAHLDRTPLLRLVDAVDPDDSHRASLLFELRGGTSRQFALYRLTSARAEQTFTTASIE